ncbi:hypothetical protein [Pleomorphovibrio marinus]|uniref:hypothetical protein n=1 Tax=Pleomorphovibrio marinus TaxID=2164132 RepID=UPI000E0C5D33|nr:hypothetical protein [Pleomorphovibrio marinus]
MVKIFTHSLIIILITGSISLAQVEEEIKVAAQIYAYALKHHDQDVLLDFTYPALVEKAGGRPAMKRILQGIQQTQLEKGQVFQGLELRFPINHVKVKEEIHALVPVVIKSKVPGGILISETTLIAVATDQRSNWYFIETTSLDERNVQKVVPTWDNSLMLPPKKAPIFKEDKFETR